MLVIITIAQLAVLIAALISRDDLSGCRMFTARKKIQKEKGAEPDPFEESVAQVSLAVGGLGYHAGPALIRETALQVTIIFLQALFDLEATNNELKNDLRDLYITGAKEVDVAAARKAIIIHVSLHLAPREKFQFRYLFHTLVTVNAGPLPPAEGFPQNPAPAGARAGEKIQWKGCGAGCQPEDHAALLVWKV